MQKIRIKRMLIIIAITVFGFYCLLLSVLYLFQEDYIYFPSDDIAETPEDLNLEYDEVFFVTQDNVKLWGWWIPVPSARGTVLICHGNAGNITHRLEKIRIFTQLRLNCFIFDYRGYGKSEGKPNEEGTYKDVLAGWDFFNQ